MGDTDRCFVLGDRTRIVDVSRIAHLLLPRGSRRDRPCRGCTIPHGQTITFPVEDDDLVTFPDDNAIRIDVLQRLAEQAMSDDEFRAQARDDLPAALLNNGYDLTPSELALVLRFRDSLADAGVDLDLVDGIGDERLGAILDRLQRHARSAGWS